MGRTATIIAVSYAVACAFAIVFMLFVAVSTRGRRRANAEGLRKLREQEKTWFAIVIVLLVALLFATIFFTPYGRSARARHQTVDVRAVQFAWLIRGKPIKAGTPVVFRLTSADVNHGMAVYTQGGKLLFQVQVMPGKTQTYVYTFKKPGKYKILCLEYCGVDHDLMQSRLTVTP
jgi:cytochrome c oxidase subunit II